jgi:hypothetical protein
VKGITQELWVITCFATVKTRMFYARKKLAELVATAW